MRSGDSPAKHPAPDSTRAGGAGSDRQLRARGCLFRLLGVPPDLQKPDPLLDVVLVSLLMQPDPSVDLGLLLAPLGDVATVAGHLNLSVELVFGNHAGHRGIRFHGPTFWAPVFATAGVQTEERMGCSCSGEGPECSLLGNSHPPSRRGLRGERMNATTNRCRSSVQVASVQVAHPTPLTAESRERFPGPASPASVRR